MPKTKAEYCRWHAERMLTVAKECSEPSIRELVEAMAKEWVNMAVLEDRRTLELFEPEAMLPRPSP
jgi:hypothetical protein